MKSKCEFKERPEGGKVEISLPNGAYFRITFSDKQEYIQVQTIDGRMIIMPSVSNEVKISQGS